MESVSELHGYNRGYADGYQAGLADGLAGKQPGGEDARALPIAYLGLSTRAYNCLYRQHLQTIGEVADLPEDRIFAMRNLGKIGADEIARALQKQRIFHTDWDRYLLDPDCK